MTKSPPKNFYCEIPVAPEDKERFLNGCKHYGMTAKIKRGNPYILIGFDNLIDFYWLAANIFGQIPLSSLTKRSF